MTVAAVHNLRAWRRAVALERDQDVDDAFEPSSRWGVRPSISILVAAWNEAPLIERHLASFARLTYSDLQMVICAGGTDGTYAIASRFAGDRLIVLEQRSGEGKQSALRRCLAAATGQVIVLTDADCLITEDQLERLIEPITRGTASVTTGFHEPLPEQRDDPFVLFQWLSLSGSRPRSSGSTSGVLGANCAVVRKALDSSGALDARAATGTDYVLGHSLMQAGDLIRLVPASRVMTSFPSDPASYVETNRRWVKNLLINAPRFRAWRDALAAYLGIVLATTILVGPIAAIVVGRRAFIVPSTAAVIATMNCLRRLALGARRTNVEITPRLVASLPFFVLLDQVAVLLAAFDSITPRGRSRW